MPLDMTSLLNNRLTAFKSLTSAEAAAIYSQLRTYESDYDKAQSTLRTIASAWILAAIGAVGLVIQSEAGGANKLDPFVAASLRQALLLIAALGLSSLWFLDLRVYQRLLHAVFSLGCHLELANDNLLPIRSRAYLLNYDITYRLGWFYRAPLLVLLCAAIVSLYHSIFGLHQTVLALSNCSVPAPAPASEWVLPLLIAAFHVFFFVRLRRQSDDWPSLDPLLPADLVEARKAMQQATSASTP